MYGFTPVSGPVQRQELTKLPVRKTREKKMVFKQCRKKLVGEWKEYEIRKKNDVPTKWKLLTLKEHLALHER